MKNPFKLNNWKQWKTSISGLLLIVFSVLELVKWNALESQIFGVEIEVAGILLGLGLILIPDTILSKAKKKVDD